MIKEAIQKLVDGQDLGYDETARVMDEMMSGIATQAQTAAFLTALRIKGETIDEITACAEIMRNKAQHVERTSDALDIVGTGGDGSGTFNISTTSAFVIGAGGVKVAKHGNRSMSSKSGAADCLERLGANLSVSPERNAEILEQTGVCFMFAQVYHSSMRFVAPVRKEIGIRNIFNLLGPLTNPASANLQVTGVYSEALVEPVARVFSNLGVTRGYTFYGLDGTDEVSVTAPTRVCEIDNGSFKTYEISPEQFGMPVYKSEDILGGNAEENAEITERILSGEEKGAKRDIVLLNSALGLCAADKAASIEEGVKLAAKLIDSGKALAKLKEFIRATNE